MYLYISLVLLIFLLAAFYSMYILSKKLKTYEDWILDTQSKIEDLQITLKNIDDREIFEKDDEVGVLFDEIRDLVNDYKTRIMDE
jgi:hypothetical protein